MVEYPPSLSVNPAAVTRTLASTRFTCARCGQMLRGLPAPHCPECGHWTDFTSHLRHCLIAKHVKRLGKFGVVDRHLLRFRDQIITQIIPLTADMTFTARPRLSVGRRWFRMLLAIFAGGSAFGALILLEEPTTGMVICGMGLILIAAFLIGQIGLMDGIYDFTLTCPDGAVVSESQETSGQTCRSFVDRVNAAIESPVDATPDEAPEPTDPDRCAFCAYPLTVAPPIAIRNPRRDRLATGIAMTIFGLFFTACCGFVLKALLPVGLVLLVYGIVFVVRGIPRSRTVIRPPAAPSFHRCPACRTPVRNHAPTPSGSAT
jgi:hypothetical protein